MGVARYRDPDSRFQILAIDGGGVRGIFVAGVLAALEADLEQPVAERFDLIVGTSTGGIIALALGAGLIQERSPHAPSRSATATSSCTARFPPQVEHRAISRTR